MVTKSGTARRRPDPAARIVDGALALAAREGWARIGLADIAAEAGLPLSELLTHFRSKGAIQAAFMRRIDEQVVAGTDSESLDQPARDRLFDVLMRRFDALSAHKEAVRAMVRDSARDPLTGLCGGVALLRSMALMLECAALSSSGVKGLVRAEGLTAIYLATLRAWLRDDSEDMSRAMAELDKQLRRADQCIARLCFRRRDRGDGRRGDGTGQASETNGINETGAQ